MHPHFRPQRLMACVLQVLVGMKRTVDIEAAISQIKHLAAEAFETADATLGELVVDLCDALYRHVRVVFGRAADYISAVTEACRMRAQFVAWFSLDVEEVTLWTY